MIKWDGDFLDSLSLDPGVGLNVPAVYARCLRRTGGHRARCPARLTPEVSLKLNMKFTLR